MLPSRSVILNQCAAAQKANEDEKVESQYYTLKNIYFQK